MDENGSTDDGDVNQSWRQRPKSSLERVDYGPRDSADHQRRRQDSAYNDRTLRSDGEFVYPQRQFARTELVVPSGGRLEEETGEEEEREEEQRRGEGGGSSSCRPGTGADDAGNCNGRSGGEDVIYDELLVDFLPSIRGTFAKFDGLDRSGCDRDATRPLGGEGPAADDDCEGETIEEGGENETTLPPSLKQTSQLGGGGGGTGGGGTGGGGGNADSSIMKLIKSLGMMSETDRPGDAEEGSGGGGGVTVESRRLDQETLGRVADKVDNWIVNQGQLIEAAYRRGTESSQKRLKLLTQQLTTCKQRLFEVSRDRQAIMTYVRRYEKNWTCRQERLRMEILRLQKILHDSQKSSAQLEENRQLYEGESGSPRLKTEETLDKVLAVVVEHQNKINELKLTVFAQQQHILSLEEERQNNALLSLAANDNKSTCEQSGSKESNEHEGNSQGKKEVQKTSEDQTKSSAEPALSSSSSPVATLTEPVDSRSCTSKMSDVLLCDEGEYMLCQANQSEGATDEAMTNLRCLCHQHGASCGNFAQVQLVGHLPYLMDSPLDTEVAGVLARPKIRPFAVADLPFVRQRNAGKIPQENVQFEFDVFK